MSLEILGVVQARSGSKGLPGKNIRPLAGKPLMAWMIEHALDSKYMTRIICSTDSQEYAQIAREFGAETPFIRPKEFATDTANDIHVLTHAVQWLQENENYRPDIIVRLQPTNPTFPTEKIDRGIELLLADEEADSLRPVFPTPKHPYKMWKMSKDRKSIVPPFPKEMTGFDEPYAMGRQQLPEFFVHAGAMDVLRYRTLIEKNSMAGDKVIPLLISDPVEMVNIDTPFDFLFAEFVMNQLLKKITSIT